jgi:hypothetical protein
MHQVHVSTLLRRVLPYLAGCGAALPPGSRCLSACQPSLLGPSCSRWWLGPSLRSAYPLYRDTNGVAMFRVAEMRMGEGFSYAPGPQGARPPVDPCGRPLRSIPPSLSSVIPAVVGLGSVIRRFALASPSILPLAPPGRDGSLAQAFLRASHPPVAGHAWRKRGPTVSTRRDLPTKQVAQSYAACMSHRVVPHRGARFPLMSCLPCRP